MMVLTWCDCDCGDKCPNGKVGSQDKCCILQWEPDEEVLLADLEEAAKALREAAEAMGHEMRSIGAEVLATKLDKHRRKYEAGTRRNQGRRAKPLQRPSGH